MGQRSGFGIALKAVIWWEGKFLILKRAKNRQTDSDLWEFPGGGLEIGEQYESALVREIMEETALEATVVKPLSVWDAKRKDGTQVLGITFLCELKGGNLSLSDEHTEHAWIHPDEIDSYNVFAQMAKEVKSWSL